MRNQTATRLTQACFVYAMLWMFVTGGVVHYWMNYGVVFSPRTDATVFALYLVTVGFAVALTGILPEWVGQEEVLGDG